MLVDDGFTVTQVDLGIKSLQLISGESIVGHVWYNAAAKQYDIDNPVSPQLRQTQDGRVNVSLNPLRPWLKDIAKQTIGEAHVIYVSSVPDEMERAYRQLTSSVQIVNPTDLNSLLSQK